MTQKTLLSFFVPQNQKHDKKTCFTNSEKEEIDRSADEDSPVKTAKNKSKRLRIVSSGSENESDNDKQVKENSDATIKKNTNQKSAKHSIEQGVKDSRHSVFNDLKSSNKEKNEINKKAVNTESKVSNTSSSCNSPNKKKIDKEISNEKNNSVAHKNVEGYSPISPKYDPIKDACWSYGEKVPYYALAKTFEEIEKESARLKMIEILSNFLRSVIVLSPEDLLPSIYLCLNKLGPAHESLELGLAEQTLIRAISQCTGRTVTQIRNESQEVGDLGLVAEKSRSSQKLMFKPLPLTVSGIFKKFTEIAKMTGKTAVNKKISICETLFIACKGPEAKFLVRSLNGRLRIGLAEQSVLQAIALACASTPPGQLYPPTQLNVASTMSSDSFKALVDELALTLKTTYCECPNYGLIIPILLKEGIAKLPEHCKITPGLPMKPMLAQPTKGVQEVLSRFENMEFTCEWKYDGERAQIHFSEDGEVRIFSRSQENYTTKYPDIISRINRVKKVGVTSFIIDCEAVAWDKQENQILPFQVLSTRKRKDATESDIKVPVCVFMFDILYLNGKSLVKEKFLDRRRLLRENFIEIPGEWMFASFLDTNKMEEVQEFLEESIKMNCEGLMVKTLKDEATYEIAKRSRNWLKLKKDYLDGVGDTLDLVVLGGYLGKGKRTGTYGGFLIGCYDSDNDGYQSVCKLGTGFSDESLIKHAEFFKSYIISKPPSYYHYDTSMEPDHWFKPAQVWETKCADLSLSPIHRAAIGVIDPEKGISLRFPRFLRVREDKRPEQATTAQEIIHLYQNQEQVKNQQNFSKFKEEDFY